MSEESNRRRLLLSHQAMMDKVRNAATLDEALDALRESLPELEQAIVGIEDDLAKIYWETVFWLDHTRMRVARKGAS